MVSKLKYQMHLRIYRWSLQHSILILMHRNMLLQDRYRQLFYQLVLVYKLLHNKRNLYHKSKWHLRLFNQEEGSNNL